MLLGAILFILAFIMIAPKSQAFVAQVAIGFMALMTAWAPFSYLLLLILVSALFAGVYLIHSWPRRVDPENPMAKYRRESPVEEE